MKVLYGTKTKPLIKTFAVLVFGTLAAIPEPNLIAYFPLVLIGITVGYWDRELTLGILSFAVLAIISLVRELGPGGQWASFLEDLPSAILRAGVPWLVAVALRQYISIGEQAARERELTRERHFAQIEKEASQQRVALSQTLHDELGHSLSLVALSLGRLELDSSLPQTTRNIVMNARQELSFAVERLGDSIRHLQNGRSELEPHLTPLQSTIRRSLDAGGRFRIKHWPDRETLKNYGSELIDQIIAEAVTNSNRHAPGEEVAIDFESLADVLCISITNPLNSSSPPSPGSGTGLTKLTDLVNLHGGNLEISTTPSHFSLRVKLIPAAEKTKLDNVHENSDSTRQRRSISVPSKARGRLIAIVLAIIITSLAAVEVLTYIQ